MIIIEYNLIAYISSMACPANGDFFSFLFQPIAASSVNVY